jgi:glycosyltransferase involved in cell wall biosynthesis
VAPPDLLYLTPVMPALTGNGLAMRAGMVLEALAAHYSVWLHVLPLYPGPGLLPDALKPFCRNVEVAEAGARRSLSRVLRDGRKFHTVHVFRLAALPYAAAFLKGGPKLHLDLDDIESLTHCRLAALHRLNGDAMGAILEEALARTAANSERDAINSVNRVYVCSGTDKARVGPQPGAEIVILPNGVRIPQRLQGAARQEPFRFLMVGTLGYYPNDDAACYFCREIVPRLRERARRPFLCEIVGGGISERLRDAAAAVGAQLPGRVPDLERHYRDASVVVTPIRAGGGTRIKILEAFSRLRPVVSTSIGAEGLAVAGGRELLTGDTAEEFAAACLRLMDDPELAHGLATRAFELVQEAYSTPALIAALRPA